MPRIPEGNFKTEPNVAVPAIATPKIESDTRRLRSMGKQAGQIGDALEKSEKRVESLKIAKDTSDNWKNNEKPVIDEMHKLSTGGFINKGTQLSDGTVFNQNTKLEDAVRGRVNKFNMKSESEASNNPEGAAMLQKYVVGDTHNEVAKAAVFAKNQIVKDTTSSIQADFQLLNENLISGESNLADANKAYQIALDSELIVGRDTVNRLIKGQKQALAARADQIILNHPQGLDSEKISEARSLANSLPENLKVVANNRIDRAVERRSEVEFNRTNVSTMKMNNNIKTPMDLAAVASKMQEAKDYNLNAPLNKYETIQQRVSNYASIEGKSAAIEIMGKVGHMSKDDPSFQSTINERVEESFRSLASSEMMNHTDEATVKSALAHKLNSELVALDNKRTQDPAQFRKEFFPSMEMQIAKNNPEVVVPQIQEMMSEWGIPTDDQRLVANSDAKNDGAVIKAMQNGEDNSGDKYISHINTNTQRWGDSGYKALKDSAIMGGADPSMLFAVESGNEKFRASLASGHGTYEKNIAQLADTSDELTTKSGEIGSAKTAKTKFERLVKAEISESATALYFGKGNDVRYDGYVKSISYLAAQKAATQGMDLDDAVKQATEEMKAEYPSAHDGNNMIMLGAKYMSEKNIDPEKMGDMLNDALEMKHLSRAGYSLDMDAFEKATANNPIIAEKIRALKGKSYDTAEQFAEFADVMEDNIIVQNDPNDPSNIKYYLQDPKTGMISPMPVKVDGKTQQLSIPAYQYYNSMESEGETRQPFGGVSDVQ